MKIFVTTGTRCFLPSGSFAVPSAVWPEQGGAQGAMSAAGGGRSVAARTGRTGYHIRFRTLANPILVDLPVTDRLRRSASEP